MPIYKVSTSVDASRSSPQVVELRGDPAASGEVRGGGEGGMSFMEKTEADRQLDDGYDWRQPQHGRVAGTTVQLGLGESTGRGTSNLFEVEPKRNSASIDGESIVEREIKEFLKREAEWAVRLDDSAPLTAPPPAPIAAPQTIPNNHYTAPRAAAREPLLLDLSYDSGSLEQNQARTKAEKRVSFAEEPWMESDAPIGGNRGLAGVNSGVSPGETLILKEMEELKRREDELKVHWRDMGFDVPDNHHRADDIDITMENPVENSAAATRDQHVAAAGNDWNVSAWKTPSEQSQKAAWEPQPNEWKSQNEWKSLTVAPEPLRRETSRTSSQQSLYGSNAAYIAAVPLASLPPTPAADDSQPRRATRVQPFEDEDAILEDRPQFAPHEETLIQREIRLAREREDDLRVARGMPATRAGEEGGEGGVEIEVRMPRMMSVAPPDVGVENETMKKYAESRLQEELRREKDRELALRRQGSIHTISEERAGEPLKFVEIISPETEQHMQREKEKARERALQRARDQELQKQPEVGREYSVRQEAAYCSAPAPEMTSSRASYDRPDGGSDVTRRGPAGGTPAPVQYRAPRTPPKVLVTYSYNPTQLDEQGTHELVSRNEAGLRIEQEVAEAKRREEELRALRESLRVERASVNTLDVQSPSASLTSPPPATKTIQPLLAAPLQPQALPAAPLQPQPLPAPTLRINGNDDYYQGGAAAFQAPEAGGALGAGGAEGEGELLFDDQLYLSGGGGAGPRRLALIREWENKITYNST